jgi:dynein heavy chain
MIKLLQAYFREYLLQVKFILNDKTTLADLLSLNLHKFEDEVKNVVDKAVKELSMEKVLKELNETWKVMEFEHIKHPRTGITMLQTSEELIETLEDNQVILAIDCQVGSFVLYQLKFSGAM